MIKHSQLTVAFDTKPKNIIIICIRIPDNEDKPRELSGDDAVNILLVVLAANK